jgi:heme/copper-type cytochrome/quinol oxidase subunit 3
VTGPQTALAPTGYADEKLPTYASGTHSYGWWGMVLFISTEAALFGTLVAAYFYMAFKAAPDWPPAGIPRPSLALPLVMTVILWSSSLPVHLAERAITRGNQRMLRLGLLAGFVLGGIFLVLQLGVEYPEKLREFTPSTNVYGSMFFLLTGFHGFHVIVGLAFSLWTQVRARLGAFDRYRHLTVQNFTMYWHFVDAVWAAVLFAIYLSPRLFG